MFGLKDELKHYHSVEQRYEEVEFGLDNLRRRRIKEINSVCLFFYKPLCASNVDRVTSIITLSK
jgi:hypothetical protein